MVNFILIAICILAGFVLRRSRLLPQDAHKGINVWIIYLAVPAVALKYIPTIVWSPDLLLPAVMPGIVWTGSWLVFYLYSRIKPLDPATRAALTLTAGLGNTSFIGFPLIQAYYGDRALPIAVICDQVSFLVMSVFGAMTAMSVSQAGGTSIKALAGKLFTFPPFIASLIAVVLSPFISFTPILPLCDKIAATLVPLALFSVGMQLSFEGWRNELSHLSVGLGYKLIIAPLLIFIIVMTLHLRGIIPQISIFEAAMAPMITAGVIAVEYDLNPRLANLMVGIGILLSFITTGIWWLAISNVGA